MRALLPESARGVDVHDHYARDWTDHGGIRANMIASVDGASDAAGASRGLQTPGDNRVFAALRDLADVVLVGAATAATEGYRPVRVEAGRAAMRRRFGLRGDLPIALVTRTLQLDLTGPLFADPQRRPFVITVAAADTAGLHDRAEVIVCGERQLDFGDLRREFAARGLTRVLCEGGPRLLSALIEAGELDELCLSLTPLLVGPGGARIVHGASWPTTPVGLQLHSALEEDGALFLRYTGVGSAR